MVAAIANRVYAAYAAPARRRFERALRDPAAAQRAVLLRILAENAGSELGRRHGFGSITSPEEFRARLEPADYDALAPDIDRVANGMRNVVTAHEVFCFERTTGSRGACKLIPYSRALLREFSAATLPWIHDLLTRRPALLDGRAYWAVTPPARTRETTPGGSPVGMEHDSDYFPAAARMLLDHVLGMPRGLSRVRDIDAARYVTLRALLALDDLTFVSVWNPSFLSLLADALDEHWPALIRDMEHGTLSIQLDPDLRRELGAALPARPWLASLLQRRFGRRAPTDLGAVWPRLALISCWSDGHAARALDAMALRFPRVEIQGKGLLATEGVVSVPLFDAGGPVAAVTSHFLEFVPEHGGDPRGVEQLETGAQYEVLLTTSGGLYRYRLKDLVRVDGWYHGTPRLSFRGRADRTSDLAGEKISPAFAEAVLTHAIRATGARPGFAMLAPVWGRPPAYRLFVECDASAADALARGVEAALLESHHYALCRTLGQLGAVAATRVAGAEETYERVCASRGQRVGTIKPTALDDQMGWERAFVAVDVNRGVA